MNIVIFGPPGAGKGTQSNLIVEKFDLHQLSTGELLRKEIKDNTKLGLEISSLINDGNLVSDNIVGDLIEKYLANKIYKNRLIFDGYPRNLIQARNLDHLLNKYSQRIDLVLKLSVSLETINFAFLINDISVLIFTGPSLSKTTLPLSIFASSISLGPGAKSIGYLFL